MRRLILVVLSISACTYGDLSKVDEARNNFALAWSKCGTVDLGSRMDTHKAMIAAYLICPGDLVLDVGCHLGSYASYYDRLVGDTGHVIAYEASPLIFSVVKEHTQSEPNITFKNKAVSHSSGEKILMKIYPDEIGPQCCSVEPVLWNEERMPGRTQIVEVETERLDDLLPENHRPIHFIKIDVEGHEWAVLAGMTELLALYRPFVIFEYGYVKGVYEPNTIQQIENIGYVCYDCGTDQRVYPGFEIPVTDLLAIPVERRQEMIEVLPYLHY